MANKGDIIDIYFKIGVDDKPLEEGLDNAGKKTLKFGDILKANLISSAVEKGLSTLYNGIKNVASVISNNLTPAVSRLDTLNSYGKTMEALGFSTDQATEAQSKLSNAIDGLPTTLDGIISWQQQFTALTDDIEGATNLTIALNNATLAAGKGQEVANNAMGNWYAIIASGMPDAQHWQSLYSAMPAQMNQLAEAVMGAGKKSDDLFEAWKNGEVSLEQVTNALVRLNSEGVEGVASFEDQAQIGAQTIATAYGNISTAIGKNIAKVLDVLNGDTSEGGGRIVELLLSVKTLINDIGNSVAQFVKDHEPEISAIMNAINAIFKGEDIAENFKTMLENASTIVQDIFNRMKNFIHDNKDAIVETLKAMFSSFVDTLVELIPVLLPIAVTMITTLCSTLLDNLPLIIESAVQVVVSLVEGIQDSLPALVPAILDAIMLIADTLLDNVGTIIDCALVLILGLVEGIAKALPKLHRAIPQIIGTIVGVIIRHLPEIIMVAIEVIVALTEGLIEALPILMETILILVQSIVDELSKGPTDMGQVAIDWAKALINGFIASVKSLWNTVVTAVGGFFNKIGENTKNNIDAIVNNVKEKLNNAWQAIYNFFEPLINFVKPILDALKYLFETIFEAIKVLVERALTAIKDKFTEIWNNIVNFLTPILESIRSYISTKFDAVKEKITEVWNAVKTFLSNTFENIKTKVKDAFDAVYDRIKTPLENAKTAVSNAFNTIKTTITNVVDSAKTWGADLIQNFIDGISSMRDSLARSITGVADKIHKNIGFSEPEEGPLSNFHTYAPDMIDLFTKGLYANERKLQNAFSDVFQTPSLDNIQVSANMNEGSKAGNSGTRVINPTINVYASEGQDIRQLAKEVSRELQALVEDEEMVYA